MGFNRESNLSRLSINSYVQHFTSKRTDTQRGRTLPENDCRGGRGPKCNEKLNHCGGIKAISREWSFHPTGSWTSTELTDWAARAVVAPIRDHERTTTSDDDSFVFPRHDEPQPTLSAVVFFLWRWAKVKNNQKEESEFDVSDVSVRSGSGLKSKFSTMHIYVYTEPKHPQIINCTQN